MGRTLYVQRHLSRSQDPREQTLEQQEGAVYLSSPCCFPHAVGYPATSWERRIVAVQCRVMLDPVELFETADADPKGGTMSHVMAHVASMTLCMPTLEEVQTVAMELERGRQRAICTDLELITSSRTD